MYMVWIASKLKMFSDDTLIAPPKPDYLMYNCNNTQFNPFFVSNPQHCNPVSKSQSS